MVDAVGFEPTMSEDGGFTVRWNKPLSHTSKKLVNAVGFEPTVSEDGRFTVCWNKPLSHAFVLVEAVGFEPTVPEDGGFTVRWNKPLSHTSKNYTFWWVRQDLNLQSQRHLIYSQTGLTVSVHTQSFLNWWMRLDSNQRCPKTADLQSAGISLSPTHPNDGRQALSGGFSLTSQIKTKREENWTRKLCRCREQRSIISCLREEVHGVQNLNKFECAHYTGHWGNLSIFFR